MNLNTNWDNGLLAGYVEDMHLNEIDIDPLVKFPLGRDCNQLVAGPSISPGTKAIAMVPEPSAQPTEAMAPELEPSAQTSEAMTSALEQSAPFDLFGPSTGEESFNQSFDMDAILNSPAFATVDPTLGSKGEIPQEATPENESDNKQNVLDLTLTETSADDVLAVKDRSKELVVNCEEEMSIDNSDSTRVEEDQMEISPDSNITN